ncbi:FecCD family ABC transporter permease [Corynebacterium ulcerans]|uniref:Iron(III) dicitrate transport system permease fecD n=2 Tax=Corynebacterium ulcerans TaxID=65058 RepID=A0ABD7MVB0_CORUL|nr:iron ABC transporter permease [Corynebacterium ulcerans]AIT90035.1 Iron(III) dicitrate transport system permease fecD [Corynebacterium ulcerans]ALD95833.1 Iron(III) dicitrate transport system permease fecD [Corynebacterium ulcerans]KKO84729.1 iron ABC transporter permease [Corynebacterium ulcerans]KKO86805.1 iron ABC transporter permease [Corynebacterium ulcerans]KPH74082.1 iron ABC transporter permease [Corynebacterium ulcerans]
MDLDSGLTTQTVAPGIDSAPQKRRFRPAFPLVVMGGIILLIALSIGSVFVGTASLSWNEVMGAFGFAGYDTPSLLRQSILFELRIPRILMGIVVGAGLAVAGACLQTVTHNPLAEPYLLGISGGASVGAVVVLVIGTQGVLGLTAGAALGGLGSFVVLLMLLRGSGFQSQQVVLAGVLVGQFAQAVTFLIMMGKGDADSIQAVMAWLMGALGASRQDGLLVTAIVCMTAIAALWALSRHLDTLRLGDATAHTMGVPVVLTRGAVLVIVALMTSATVASVGAIGFVGLIVPHAVRLVVGSAHVRVIPISALVGAILLVVADAIARSLFKGQELPVGIITALIGVPIFFLLWKKGKK